MCGFVGYLGPPTPLSHLAASRDLLTHRGPDAEGLWEAHYADHSVGLGFRRLKILDLSPAADQPMSRDGIHLVYNGEIYNFRELRAELESKGHAFRSTGDTEVVLLAYKEWGLGAIERLKGMFAFAIWDEGARRLLLVRDRAGIKPLYYGEHKGRFAFASEPKAVLALSGKPVDLDERSLAKFLTFLWVPDPDTMFRGIYKLPPGHFAILDGNGLRVRQYWDLAIEEEPGSLEEHAERLREAIRAAVVRQLVADVPIGVFLSGGLDSTLIARHAADGSVHPVLAIATEGPEDQQRLEPGVRDLPYARLAAKEIPNLHYREIILRDGSADAIGDLIGHMDDPVADPAAISTFLICKAAKPHARVMLSGVGAEELFAGYPRHRVAVWGARLGALPPTVRRPFGWAARVTAGARPGGNRRRHAKKFLEGLAEPEPNLGFVAHHTALSLSALLGREVDWEEVTEAHTRHLSRVKGLPPLTRALYLDFKTFLPSLNLAYTDRASMAMSVEVRVPFLDERVVDSAARTPDRYKLAHGTSKVVLRSAASREVPDAILTRPKSGFGAPVRRWIAEPSGAIETSLDELGRRGLVRDSAIRRMRRAFLAGRSDQSLQIWATIVLELWAKTFVDQAASTRV